MEWLTAAYWGAFGGFAIEVLDYCRAVRWHRKRPWNVSSASVGAGPSAPRAQSRPGDEELPAPGWLAYLLGAVLRVVVGGGVAGALAASPPHGTTPWIALIVGAGALTVMEKSLALVTLVTQVSKDAVIGAVMQHQNNQRAQLDASQPVAPPQESAPLVPRQDAPGTDTQSNTAAVRDPGTPGGSV
ncbi:hypothetical protein [Streptomyces naganishii]|uniref:hypothetical protein n=1 Tax=Streptomyces naganishii TaxID=285447 RepID=UPI00167E9574|nr:hypothetical protein [Streptomyces naganishii]